MNRSAILTILATLASLGVLLLLLIVGGSAWTAYRGVEDRRWARFYAMRETFRGDPGGKTTYFRRYPDLEREYLRMEREYLRTHPDAGPLDPPDAGSP
jgi:hypothetical protein